VGGKAGAWALYVVRGGTRLFFGIRRRQGASVQFQQEGLLKGITHEFRRDARLYRAASLAMTG
jgi:hypothetical protein